MAELPASCRETASAVVAALADTSNEGSAGARVEQLCSVMAPLVRSRYPDWTARLADYEQLVAAAADAQDVPTFVSELVLDPPASSADLAGPPHLDEDYLVLSTVHSAKGLEWEAVHVIAAYDGNFPADMNAGTAEGIAEERRLLYVALTRARRRLHVYVPKRYYHRPHARDDAHGYGKASRFLSADVQELFQITHSALCEPSAVVAPGAGPRIEVSVDALFGG
jgi:DNA helicase-2/ATP-dependent DNA helicase PcrA